MKIKPCLDDIISVVAIWPVIIVIECLVIFVSKLNAFFFLGIVLLNALLFVSSVRDFLYLSRTIILDHEGCTFSIWRFCKKYKWSSLKVQLCDDSKFVFSDSTKALVKVLFSILGKHTISLRNSAAFSRILSFIYSSETNSREK